MTRVVLTEDGLLDGECSVYSNSPWISLHLVRCLFVEGVIEQGRHEGCILDFREKWEAT